MGVWRYERRAIARMMLAAIFMLASAIMALPAKAELGPAARFGARQAVLDASISPDGGWLAIVGPLGPRGSAVFVADLNTGKQLDLKRILASEGKPERIVSCAWSSNQRLLCKVYAVMMLDVGELATASRYIAIDRDGANMKMIETPRGFGDALNYSLFGGDVIDMSPGQDGHVLMMRRYVPESSLGTRGAQTRDGLGVDNLDTATGNARIVETPRTTGRIYLADGAGSVRIMAVAKEQQTDDGSLRYLFRRKGSRNWEPLGEVDADQNGFTPHFVDPKADLAYGLRRKDGRFAAWTKTLDGAGVEQLIFAHPGVDVDGFVTVGRERRVVGVRFVTDRSEAYYFDPALEKLAKGLAKALPNQPLIRFLDASQDEKRLLIWAGSDIDPGQYYLFDKATGTLDLLMPERGDLSGIPLATVRAITYKAADGTMVPAYLTLPAAGAQKGLPAIVLPHGGPSARDEWGFDWLTQYLVSQGYAVLQPNFRGSAGYGDAWFQQNGIRGWRTAIGDVSDAGRWLISEGIADPAKLSVLGWSYGGYAALQSAVTYPDLFKAVIAIAPVTDFNRLKEEWRNWTNFRSVSRFIGDGPHIDEGSPARHAERIKAPVLIFHGTMDRNVGIGQSRLMEERLKKAGKPVTLITYDGLDHALGDSIARADMLGKISAFLAAATPGK
ncbi:alpha/beta hydrolase family protein [Sphingobium phenoxybenzoativorans]|uniref:alpha/beta hydrolase family protein n=1 Tax=Sphingobium phenoxybenzoativorans TaxID=1592790 RepID=UPI00209A9089|nr:S9 family peptidase [Sphingobium phenoxybenzoativorans]